MELKKGNILLADVEAVVNPVNCVGVMGKGLAAQFKASFPENFRAYAECCKLKTVVPGKMHIFETKQFVNPRYIINFPTKRHWRENSRFEDVENGLIDLVNEIQEREIQSIAIPPLGCGLGGLDWNKILPLIEKAFNNLSTVRVVVYEPWSLR